MTIRLCDIEDIQSIQKIAHTTWPVSYADMISKEQISYMLELMYNHDKLKEQMRNGHSFYLLEEEGLIGFVGVEPNIEEGYAFVHKLYILPEYQGQGFGKVLMNHVQDLSTKMGINEIRLNVNRTNEAVQFYKKNGFEILKTIDIDIGNGFFMNDYTMSLKF